MARRHQTTLVTVTYPVINYILLTVADTFCLSDISPVPNCNNSQSIFLFRLISCLGLYTHTEQTADVVKSHNQSASRKQRQGTFPSRDD